MRESVDDVRVMKVIYMMSQVIAVVICCVEAIAREVLVRRIKNNRSAAQRSAVAGV